MAPRVVAYVIIALVLLLAAVAAFALAAAGIASIAAALAASVAEGPAKGDGRGAFGPEPGWGEAGPMTEPGPRSLPWSRGQGGEPGCPPGYARAARASKHGTRHRPWKLSPLDAHRGECRLGRCLAERATFDPPTVTASKG